MVAGVPIVRGRNILLPLLAALTLLLGWRVYQLFPRYALSLESNASTFRSGQEVVLTLTPKYDLSVQKDPVDRLELNVKHQRTGRALLSTTIHESLKDPSLTKEGVQLWRRGQSIQIKGKILSTGDSVTVNLERFGEFKVVPPASCELYFWFSPWKPEPLDSLEDYSNPLTLEILP